MTEHGLPTSLDALNRPTGLPPSFLRKAEEVRLGNGPENLRAMYENVENLHTQVTGLLDEVLIFFLLISNDPDFIVKAMDFLDQEATEDETFRTNHPITASKHTREHPISHEANMHLTSKSTKYREHLEKGLESNQQVQDKIDKYDDDIHLLSLPQVCL